MTRKLAWGWAAVLAAVVAYFFTVYGTLPERVATHFDAMGNPNGYQSKSYYLGFFLSFITTFNAVLVAFYFLMERIPVVLVNVPQKNYWLATSERMKEMFQKLRGVVCLLGLFCNMTFLFTVHVIYQENTANTLFRIPVTGGVAVILTGLVFVALFIFIILRPPADTV